MNKLETLKNLVADWFQECDPTTVEKSQLERLAKLKAACDDVEQEQDKLQTEHKELMKDYKELISHTSFNDQHNQPKDNLGGNVVSFEEALDQFMKNK